MVQASTIEPSIASVEDGANRSRDQIVINGVSFGFDEILNQEFFAPKRVDSLRDAFKDNVPFKHIVFEGLFRRSFLS